jgi:hypothetical protein
MTGTRVYILLEVIEGKAKEAAETLRGNPGVKLAGVLEGQPNVIVVLQACSRSKLAELTNRALALAEGVTENLQVLPTANGRKSPSIHRKSKSHYGE